MELWDDPVFHALVESLEECVLAVDAAGCITAMQCAIDELVPGVKSGANLVGRRLDEIFPAEVARAFQVALPTLERTGSTQTVNYRQETADGTRHFSARLARPRVGGRSQGILIAIWDVTRHALVHKTMLESEAFYRLLAENTSDLISVENESGTYLYVSPSVTRLVGRTPEEVVGRDRTEFVHPEDLERMRERSAGTLLPPPEGARVRFRVRHMDGHWLWVESQVQPVEWEGRAALLVSTRDITRVKQAEEKAAATLEQLEEARTRAESANRAKSALLAGISHDLRTPLHGILGMSELLEQTHLTPEQEEYVAAIRESGDTLLSRLNDLLDLSKIESGTFDLQLADFDLVEAVEGLVDILGKQAAAKGIDLFCHVPPEVPPVVRGDPQRLRQVLLNVVDNGIKFTNRGEVDVRVSLAPDGCLRFVVRDTGVGMRPDQVDEVLGKEVKGERARGHRQGRAGLGLTVTRQLVELMGGQLRVESTERGTTFSFELPLPPSERPMVDTQERVLAGRRILATDDNATNRQLIREVLEQAGAEVELTSGGVETIRNLLDDPAYHCVVLNANLPDLDGLATAAMIRSNRTLEQLPLVLMVSSAEPDEVQRSRELGVNAVLTKPVRRDVLVRAVAEVMRVGSFEDVLSVGREGTILVVEDNDVNLRLARDILRRAGYGVVSARDGKEALRQLEHHAVDAVLMDIQLPDMDGLEATARIRGTPAWAHLPIIAMTAHAMKGDAERFVRAGVDDYLSKPVNRLELLTCLDREIGRRRPAGPAS